MFMALIHSIFETASVASSGRFSYIMFFQFHVIFIGPGEKPKGTTLI
jgi:hypothetical protein